MPGSPKRLKSGAKIDYAKYEKGRKYNRDQEASPEFKVRSYSSWKSLERIESKFVSNAYIFCGYNDQ